MVVSFRLEPILETAQVSGVAKSFAWGMQLDIFCSKVLVELIFFVKKIANLHSI
jgi:hypothetical protein